MGKEEHWCIATSSLDYECVSAQTVPKKLRAQQKPSSVSIAAALQWRGLEQRRQHMSQRRTCFVTAAIMSVEQRQYEGPKKTLQIKRAWRLFCIFTTVLFMFSLNETKLIKNLQFAFELCVPALTSNVWSPVEGITLWMPVVNVLLKSAQIHLFGRNSTSTQGLLGSEKYGNREILLISAWPM